MVKNIKILNKILIILTIIVALTTTFSNIAYAKPNTDDGAPPGGYTDTGTGDGKIKTDPGKIIDPDNYNPGDQSIRAPKAEKIVGTFLSTLQVIGIVIAIICISIIGIQYIVGSVEQKAEYKKTMIPMVIGAVLLVATTTIVKTIYSVVAKNV